MKIAIDTSPLQSGHKVRGVGYYVKNLVSAIKKYDPSVSIQEFVSIKKVRADTDIIHYTYLDLFSQTQKVPNNIRTIITIHDVIPLVYPDKFPVGTRGNINHYFVKLMLKKVSVVITDSSNSKQDIAEYLPIPKEKIKVIPLAARADFKVTPKNIRLNIQKKYSIQNDYLLYVGDINWNKNVPMLINAFYDISKKHSELDLILVGKALIDESIQETRNITNLINSLNLSKRVRKLGFIPNDDLAAIYNSAEVYIQPSFYEGFGLPVLEAMQCGVPVISSDAGSLPEIVQDSGIYINPDKKVSLVNAIEKTLSLSKNDREVIIRKGLETAKHFTWKKTAEQTVRIYKSLA